MNGRSCCRQAVEGRPVAAPSGNLTGRGAGLATAVEPLTVPLTAAADAAFAALGAAITERLRRARGTAHTAILARIAENASKLALIAAVSRDPAAPVIDRVEAEWAIALVRHCAARTMREVERHVADNPVERNHKRVLELIRQAGSEGITKTELTRKSQFLERRTRDEILASLSEGGQITSRLRPSATKSTAVLVAMEADGR